MIMDHMRRIMLQIIWSPGHIIMMPKYPERLQFHLPEVDGTGPMLRGLNFFIDNYHKSQDPISETAPYIGEIYFWRAWFYYDKLKQFGDLPWIGKALYADSEELFDSRVSRTVIADSIIADLDKAISLLPEKSMATSGRIHKDVALLFQSRVALYEGTWEKYHNGTALWRCKCRSESFLPGCSKCSTGGDR